MVGRRREDAVGVGIGVRKGGIGGILMVKRGQIEDIDRVIDLISDRWIGRERGIHIEESGRGATREEEMMIGHHAGGGSGVIPQIHPDEGGIREIEANITEDENELRWSAYEFNPSTFGVLFSRCQCPKTVAMLRATITNAHTPWACRS